MTFDRAFVEGAPWRFAKTMPDTPHEYVVRGRDVPEADFDAIQRHIRRHGYWGRWRDQTSRYLDPTGTATGSPGPASTAS